MLGVETELVGISAARFLTAASGAISASLSAPAAPANRKSLVTFLPYRSTNPILHLGASKFLPGRTARKRHSFPVLPFHP